LALTLPPAVRIRWHSMDTHRVVAAVFGLLWIGTFVTGIFFWKSDLQLIKLIPIDCAVRRRVISCFAASIQ
jgi:hypothetical protein